MVTPQWSPHSTEVAKLVVENWERRAGVDGVDSAELNWRDILIEEITVALREY